MGRDILLVTKGHPFEWEPFFGLFDALPDVNWTHVEQPAAQALCRPAEAAKYDAYVFYDMPGIRFRPGAEPEFLDPDPGYRRGFMDMLEAGCGCVFLHHAIAGWPAWPEYAEVLGGRFLYMPGELRGRQCPDSGYRHGVTHNVSVVADHPVTAGLPKQFSITDELYLFEVFEDDVEPLLRSDYEFVEDNFYSATLAVRDGKLYSNKGWHHAPASNLIGWTRQHGRSRIVYLQCGDDPVAYASPEFQRLIANAIDWVSG